MASVRTNPDLEPVVEVEVSMPHAQARLGRPAATDEAQPPPGRIGNPVRMTGVA